MYKGGLVVQQKEMTKIWKDGKFVPVTLVKIVPQEIVRYKTQEKDGYSAMVIGVEKKEKTTKGKVPYSSLVEVRVKDEEVGSKEGSTIDLSFLDGVESVSVIGKAKGKGFQGVMKRFHAKGGPKTHGSKFHRQVGSLGNRKPRRVQMGHPHAGHMGGQQVTLKNIKIVDMLKVDGEEIIALKGSLPGAYNDLLKVLFV